MAIHTDPRDRYDTSNTMYWTIAAAVLAAVLIGWLIWANSTGPNVEPTGTAPAVETQPAPATPQPQQTPPPPAP